jgi:hypothetical protein
MLGETDRQVHFAFPRSWFILLPLLFIFLSCATLSPLDSSPEKPLAAALPQAVIPKWRAFAKSETDGLAYFAGKTARPRLEFWALRIDLEAPELRIVVKGGADGGNTQLSTKVSSFVRDNGLLAGINALPFDPVSGREGEPRVNVGIVVADGVQVSPPHRGYDALVWYWENGAAIVPQSEILAPQTIVNAVGGFRQILEQGAVSERTLQLTSRHPRSAAGISPDRRYLYLLVIDGRRPGSAGSTEAETALLLRALGAYDGINFDGGGSSALALRYPDGKIRAVNTPIHGLVPGRERAVAGCLGVTVNTQTENSNENR